MKTAIRGSADRVRHEGGFVVVGIVVALAAALAGGHFLIMRRVPVPPPSEFGFGPRTSGAGLYTATLIPTESLRLRKLQTVQVAIANAKGQPIDNADIGIDGGMPQHGHGLPTRPHVTRHIGNGVHEIEGVRFNMGGWWEFKLSITTASGTDLVTFNLKL
jgi:hypothetical protein